jgi:hypothetical protein
MPELAPLLVEVTTVAERVRTADADLEEARRALREALRAAHEAGASYGPLGRVVGLSRQRVARIVHGR